MKKIVLIVVGLAVLALPPAAAALKPTTYEKLLARIECGKERSADPVKRAEFAAHYPAKNPLLLCIRLKVQLLLLDRAQAPMETRISCQQEKAAEPAVFRQEYPGGIKQCLKLERELVRGPKPTKYEKLLARVECGNERGADPVKRAEFNAMYAAKRPLLLCIQFKAILLAMDRATAPAEARVACTQERAADPAGFRLEYPGGIRQCVQLESMP
jgi:hypothetical protein